MIELTDIRSAFQMDMDPLTWYIRSFINQEVFLVTDIAFLTGHSVARYIRSLAPLTPLTRFAALHFAMLA